MHISAREAPNHLLRAGVDKGQCKKSWATLNRGLIAYRLGRLDDARIDFESVLNASPDNLEAARLLSVVHMAQSSLELALETLLKIAETDPNDVITQHNLGNVLGELGRSDEAIIHYDNALALGCDDFDLHKNRAITLTELGDFSAALDSYKNALQHSVDGSLLNSCGVLLNRMNRSEEAVSYFEQSLVLDPDYFEANYNLSGCLVENKAPDDALVFIDKALELEPLHAGALNRRGEILLALKRFDDAFEFFKRTLEEHPENLALLNNTGIAAQNLGYYADAVKFYDRALLIDEDFFNATMNRAVALGFLNSIEGAIEGFFTASYLEPSSVSV